MHTTPEGFEALLVRHLPTIENKQRIVQGNLPGTPDPDFIPALRERAEQIASYAKEHWNTADLLLSGNLYRQRFSTGYVGQALAEDGIITYPLLTDLLQERCWGSAQGRSYDEAFGAFKDDKYALCFGDHSIQGAESARQISARAADIVDIFFRPDKKLIIMGSEFINNYLLNEYLGTADNPTFYEVKPLDVYLLKDGVAEKMLP